MTDDYFSKNIPRLHGYESWRGQWADGNALDVLSYLSDRGDPEVLLIFGRILFPDFLEFEGAVILNWRFNRELFESWKVEVAGDIERVESIFNSINLYDMFSNSSPDVSDEVFIELAELISIAWKYSLHSKFPDREFYVGVTNGEKTYGPVVTFHQLRRQGSDYSFRL